ncbi:hypothetical protein VNO77_15854 [Canavalia gladiata]
MRGILCLLSLGYLTVPSSIPRTPIPDNNGVEVGVHTEFSIKTLEPAGFDYCSMVIGMVGFDIVSSWKRVTNLQRTIPGISEPGISKADILQDIGKHCKEIGQIPESFSTLEILLLAFVPAVTKGFSPPLPWLRKAREIYVWLTAYCILNLQSMSTYNLTHRRRMDSHLISHDCHAERASCWHSRIRLTTVTTVLATSRFDLAGVIGSVQAYGDPTLNNRSGLTTSTEAEDFSRRHRHMTVGISVAGQRTDFLSMLETNLDGPVKIAEV